MNGAADLDLVRAWGAATVVTLVEAAELELLGIAGIGDAVRRRGMAWHHRAIADFKVPDASFAASWPGRLAGLRDRLRRGERVLLHCRGGLGRSGSIAARLLADGGMCPAAAIVAVRAARPGAIETKAQAAQVGSVL